MERLNFVVRVFLWIISVTCLLMLAAGMARSAPAPAILHQTTAPPPEQDPDLVGAWRIHWRGGVGNAVFRPQGGFTCKWFGQQWIGHWRVKENKLIVTEAVLPNRPDVMPAWFTWQATLDSGKRSGKICDGGDFSLQRCTVPQPTR